MRAMPRDENFDSTMAFLADPYDFISKRCRRYGADVFETRLLLRRTVCMSGPRAAELFCDPSRFMRTGAAPRRVRKTLFGEGGVQGLDGDAHAQRKRMFMSLMTKESIGALASQSAQMWRERARAWTTRGQVVLYHEAREVLTRAVCAWAGVPLPEEEVSLRTDQLSAMFQHAAAIGPAHWRARRARRAAERWLAALIEAVRAGAVPAADQRALKVIASHRENGELLRPHIAAVELLNVLRPTVAVSVYIVFIAHALHQFSQYRALIARDPDYAELFVQEVRRFYPFFPAGIALVKSDFDWEGYKFRRGMQAVLDLYGTNHDERTWANPRSFDPERFRSWDGSPFNFIPQGPGDHYRHHRCPGEWIAIALMRTAVRFLVEDVTYHVPASQDLNPDKSRPPALPRDLFIIGNVQRVRA